MAAPACRRTDTMPMPTHTSRLVLTASFVVIVAAGGCRQPPRPAAAPTEDVSAFLKEANETLLRLSNEGNQAGWVQQTYITPDTEAIGARADQAFVSKITEYSKKAAHMDAAKASSSDQRQ